MPLSIYKCRYCGKERETLKITKPNCNHNQCEIGIPVPLHEMTKLIIAPNSKFMITANAATGRSKVKDLKGQLTERARNHSRDTLLDENIQINKDNNLGVSNNFLNEKGERRRKIDDL